MFRFRRVTCIHTAAASGLRWRHQGGTHARRQHGARGEQARERRGVAERQEAMLAPAARSAHLVRVRVRARVRARVGWIHGRRSGPPPQPTDAYLDV